MDVETVKEVFSEFYKCVYKEPFYFALRHKKVDKLLVEFTYKVPENAGKDWVVNYVLYQFFYFSSHNYSLYRLGLTWIFGGEAFKRWEKRSPKAEYLALLYKSKIGYKSKDKVVLRRDRHDEVERNRFQEERRLIHCEDNALFWKEAKTCKKCNYFEVCRQKENVTGAGTIES